MHAEVLEVEQTSDVKKTSAEKCLQQFLSQDLHYSNNSTKKMTLDNTLMRMITQDVQPFNIVNDKGFREFVKTLDALYKLPSKTHLRNVVLPNQYKIVKALLKEPLSGVDHVAITTDCWTSQANECYITVTCHYITEDFALKSAVLATTPLLKTTNHNAVNIAETFF